MAARIATISGTALAPGVSRNGRLYTRDNIARAVERAQKRITEGVKPITMRTYHPVGEKEETRDVLKIAGRVTEIWQDADGKARYVAEIADTKAGRGIASLVNPKNPFLRGVSIRGAWVGRPQRQRGPDGQLAETSSDLEISGLDWTDNPGVDGAHMEDFRAEVPAAVEHQEAGEELYPIFESVQDAIVEAATDTVLEAGAKALKSGKAATPQTKAQNYADPGYQADKMKRYALDTKSQAKAAWSFINNSKNARAYTSAQLKRIKGRIKTALKRFGVEISADEGWLIDSVTAVAESITEDLSEYGSMAGSFSVSLTNGPVNVSVSSYCVDPHDLNLIGRAAMDGACKALATIDPDMDGDMDVPGADAEDTDDDMESAPEPAAAESVTEDAEQPAESPSEPENPAPKPVADPQPDKEVEPAMAESTTPAVEPTPAAATTPLAAPVAQSGGITLTSDQFAQLLSRFAPQTPAPQPALAGIAAESAPAAPAPVQETASAPVEVRETEAERIDRIVQERLGAAVTAAVQEHVERNGPPTRKGLVRPVTESAGTETVTDGLNQYGVPSDWPDKPLHQYSTEERKRYFGQAVQQHVLGDRASF